MVVDLDQELELSFGVKRLRTSYKNLVDGINEFDAFDASLTGPFVTVEPTANLEAAITAAGPYIRPDHLITVDGEDKLSINSVTAAIFDDLANIFKRLHLYDTNPSVPNQAATPPVRDDLEVAGELYKNMRSNLNTHFRDPTNPIGVNLRFTDFVDELSIVISERMGVEGYIEDVINDVTPDGGRQAYLRGKVRANQSNADEALSNLYDAWQRNPSKPGLKEKVSTAYERKADSVDSIGPNNTYNGILAANPAVHNNFIDGRKRIINGYETYHPVGPTEDAKSKFTAVVGAIPAGTPDPEEQSMLIESLMYLAKIAKTKERDPAGALALLDQATAINPTKEVYQLQAKYIKEMRV